MLAEVKSPTSVWQEEQLIRPLCKWVIDSRSVHGFWMVIILFMFLRCKIFYIGISILAVLPISSTTLSDTTNGFESARRLNPNCTFFVQLLAVTLDRILDASFAVRRAKIFENMIGWWQNALAWGKTLLFCDCFCQCRQRIEFNLCCWDDKMMIAYRYTVCYIRRNGCL